MPTRRTFTTLLGGAVFTAATLATRGPARAAPKIGGDLLVAFDGAAVASFVLDPHNGRYAPHARVLHSIFDSLVVLQPDQSVAPWLATKWDISPDRTQYSFTLRQDVKFHDGTPFNAAAVKANFDRIANPAVAVQSVPEIGPFTHADVLADNVVRINFSQPFEPFLHNLSSTKLAIVSPAAVAKYGLTFGQNPVGTGPFRFDSLTPGSEIRLVRNPDYRWAPASSPNQGPAYVDRLVFKNVPEQLTRVAALQSGQVQVADLIPSQNIAGFKADPGYQFLQKEILDTTYGLALNVAKAPWDDLEIRQAVRAALNIDLVVKIVYFGTIQRAWSPLSPSLFGSAEQALAGNWHQDAAHARAILDQKGWAPGPDGIRAKDGKRLRISFLDAQGNREQRLDLIQLIRRQLAAVGIDLFIDSETSGTDLQKLASGDFDATAGAQFAADPDVLRYSYVPAARSRTDGARVNDPLLNQWLTAAAAEGDAAKRAALYLQAQQRIVDQVYDIPIYILRYNLAVAKTVSGASIDTHGFPVYQAASLGA